MAEKSKKRYSEISIYKGHYLVNARCALAAKCSLRSHLPPAYLAGECSPDPQVRCFATHNNGASHSTTSSWERTVIMSKTKSKIRANREKRITIRLTEDEYKRILSEAVSANLSIAEYVRTQLRNGKVNVKVELVTDKDTKKKLAEEYHKIGVNLNQIAHHLNSGGEINNSILKDIEHNVSELARLRRELK